MADEYTPNFSFPVFDAISTLNMKYNLIVLIDSTNICTHTYENFHI